MMSIIMYFKTQCKAECSTLHTMTGEYIDTDYPYADFPSHKILKEYVQDSSWELRLNLKPVVKEFINCNM